MFVEQLSTSCFRNLTRIELSFSSRIILLRGPNGQGKTNLLEALFVCATGRSFRHARPQQMLQHGTERGTLRARFSRQGVRHQVEAQLHPRRRLMRMDDRAVRHMSALLQVMNVVAFFPDDLRLLKGPPDERRRFLDRAVANYEPNFVDAALSYTKALKSRNTLLKDRRGMSADTLAVFDEQLIQHGAVLQKARSAGLADLAPRAAVQLERIMPHVIPVTFALTSGVPGDDAGEFVDRFRYHLRATLDRDRARGTTSVGPHRADFLVRLRGQDARFFASQGQQRAVVLALKLAEVSGITARLQVAPVLLLGDVSSELDSHANELLFASLSELGSQIFITTTGVVQFTLPEHREVFLVQDGTITRSEHIS